jgi:hypothetical protein
VWLRAWACEKKEEVIKVKRAPGMNSVANLMIKMLHNPLFGH